MGAAQRRVRMLIWDRVSLSASVVLQRETISAKQSLPYSLEYLVEMKYLREVLWLSSFPVSHSECPWVQVFLLHFPLESGRRGIRRIICVGLIFS